MDARDGRNKIFLVAIFVALDVGDDDVDFHGGVRLEVFKKYFEIQSYGEKLGFASFYWEGGGQKVV